MNLTVWFQFCVVGPTVVSRHLEPSTLIQGLDQRVVASLREWDFHAAFVISKVDRIRVR